MSGTSCTKSRRAVEFNRRGRARAWSFVCWDGPAGRDRLLRSEFRRVGETGACCAEVTGLALVVDARPNKSDCGQAQGLTAGPMREPFLRETAEFEAECAGQPIPDVDEPRPAAARAVGYLAEIGDATPPGRVLVVMHHTLIERMRCQLPEVPLARARARNPSLGKSRVVRGKRAVLRQLNARLTDGKVPTHGPVDCRS